jgi:hypothetical protein
MTRGEFRAYTSRPGDWEFDPVLLHNQGTILAYQPNIEKEDEGEIDGIYIEISRDGEFCVGSYERAGEFITDSIFRARFCKRFASQKEAVMYLSDVQPKLRHAVLLPIMLLLHK